MKKRIAAYSSLLLLLVLALWQPLPAQNIDWIARIANLETAVFGGPNVAGTITPLFLKTVDASANGATNTRSQASELLVLSTGGTTTDTTANLLPANSMIDAVVGRVTTTITAGCTGWELGDATTVARFTANDTTLTAGETQVGLAHLNPTNTDAQGPRQISAAKIRVTCATAAPGAGAIRITVFFHTYAAPTS